MSWFAHFSFLLLCTTEENPQYLSLNMSRRSTRLSVRSGASDLAVAPMGKKSAKRVASSAELSAPAEKVPVLAAPAAAVVADQDSVHGVPPHLTDVLDVTVNGRLAVIPTSVMVAVATCADCDTTMPFRPVHRGCGHIACSACDSRPVELFPRYCCRAFSPVVDGVIPERFIHRMCGVVEYFPPCARCGDPVGGHARHHPQDSCPNEEVGCPYALHGCTWRGPVHKSVRHVHGARPGDDSDFAAAWDLRNGVGACLWYVAFSTRVPLWWLGDNDVKITREELGTSRVANIVDEYEGSLREITIGGPKSPVYGSDNDDDAIVNVPSVGHARVTQRAAFVEMELLGHTSYFIVPADKVTPEQWRTFDAYSDVAAKLTHAEMAIATRFGLIKTPGDPITADLKGYHVARAEFVKTNKCAAPVEKYRANLAAHVKTGEEVATVEIRIADYVSYFIVPLAKISLDECLALEGFASAFGAVPLESLVIAMRLGVLSIPACREQADLEECCVPRAVYESVERVKTA